MTTALALHVSVPTLTEVVELDFLDASSSAPALELVSPTRDSETDDVARSVQAQAELTQRVLQSLQEQVDEVLEQRLKDALVPILARCAESMMQALREDLASTLHELVAGAVAGELSRPSGG